MREADGICTPILGTARRLMGLSEYSAAGAGP
jgi:hypothetical protein